jgi:hypothetical protein
VLQTDVFPFHQRREMAEEAGAAPAIPVRGAWLATTCGQRTIRVSSPACHPKLVQKLIRRDRNQSEGGRRVKELNLQCTARRMPAFEAGGLAACPNPSRQVSIFSQFPGVLALSEADVGGRVEVPADGIEPPPPAYETGVLPLDHAGVFGVTDGTCTR